jgi:formylglycine-generating enzyme required for sulfatase activity
MHGYLWEYVADAWHDSYEGAPTDGSAWAAGDPERIVIRGGSWRDRYERLTSAMRTPMSTNETSDAVGFRCVKARRSGKNR